VIMKDFSSSNKLTAISLCESKGHHGRAHLVCALVGITPMSGKHYKCHFQVARNENLIFESCNCTSNIYLAHNKEEIS
jgi:hypothetical protein